jgi:fibronectin-binding autotransporter adhesin
VPAALKSTATPPALIPSPSGADTTLSGSTVSFNAPLVAATHSLAIVGNAVFGDTTGDDTATGLSTLSVSGTTNINTTAISASGTQVYGDTTGTDTITLGADTTLTGSSITFNAPLLAAGHRLDIVGNAVFGDSTGDDTLTGLTSLAISGSSAINTTAISSSAAQTYTGPVRLGADTTLSSSGSGAAGNISFSSTVDSDSVATARALTVNTAGTLLFGGAVGSLDALASLESDAPGSVTISGGSVITSGTQTWQDAVFITQNSLFQSAATSGTAIDFFSTLRSSGGSARSLEVDGNSAQVRFRGNLGNLTAIDSLASIEVRSSSSAPDALLLEASALSNGNQLWDAPLSFAAANNTDTVLAVGGELRFTQNVLHSNGIIEAGSGGIYFMADYLASSSGSDAPTLSGSSTDAIVISITGDMSLFNFTHFEDELLFNGSAVQLFDSNDQIIAAVRIANTGTDSGLRLSGSSVRQTGASRAIILESGWLDLATNDLGWLADSAAGGTPTADSFNGVVGSLTMSAGTELRCGGLVTESGYTVVHSGESTLLADGSVRFDGAMPNTVNSSLILSGSMVSLRAATRVGNLTIRGSVILQSDIEMDYDMLIESGAFLDVSTSNFSIELDGHWTNLQGVTGFDAQAGEVRFTRAVADGEIEIRGNNEWYRFVCEVAGQTIQFEQNRMQTFLVGGAFRVRGSSTTERITITRLSADQTSDLDWVPPTPPEASLMWQIDLLPGASLELLHVLVAYSDARAHAVAVNTDNDVELYTAANFIDNLGGETVMTCYKWLIGLLAAYSYTEDADGNGRIDRIRVTAAASLNQNFNDFEVMVQDYTIDQSKGTNGFEAITTGAFANYEFWIHLEEKTYLDTGARPRWSIIQNTSLRDGSTEKYMLINYPDQYIAGSGLYVQEPTDTAQPVLAWTLALPGMDQLYLCFSEPVFGSAAQPLASGDLQSPGAVSLSPIPAAHSTSTMAEYLVTLSAPLGISSILAGTQATLDALVNDNALAATDWSLDPSLDQFMPPPPYYPISQPVNRVLSNQHRVSDLMISVEPNMAEDNYFVWPIWAKDSVTTEIDELDYGTLSGDDAASQTIGLVRDFSSNRWLRDQDITMQVRVNPAFGAAVPELVFDSNVAAGYLATEENGPVGFWLPSFNMSDLNGLVPQANNGTASENPSPAAASLFNYAINATHPKIFDKAMVNFFFRLNSAASDLYVGRLEGEASGDWYRRIRPFSFEIRDVVLQRGRVTILNNVINPLNGETVRLSYQLTRSGPVTIQVYTLDGELVEVLYRGSRSAGDYTAVWDGTNRGGRAVARGMYFIRVVAPGIDEIRKVLVVK